MGTFWMTKWANFEIQFTELSNLKWFEANIIEYEKGQEPSCDLIIGDKSMPEFCVILNWKDKIKIDNILLPMQNKKMYKVYKHAIAFGKNHFM